LKIQFDTSPFDELLYALKRNIVIDTYSRPTYVLDVVVPDSFFRHEKIADGVDHLLTRAIERLPGLWISDRITPRRLRIGADLG
jgi:hypothetical protein